jgi:hypothetical protein
MNLGEWFKQIVTEADGETHSMQRWMGLYAFFHFHVMQIVNVFHLHQPFDSAAYGGGLAAMMAATAVMLGLAPGEKKE